MRVTGMTIVRSCEIMITDFPRCCTIYVGIKSSILGLKLQAMNIGSHETQCTRSGFSVNV